MQLQNLACIVALLAIGASALPTPAPGVDMPDKRAEVAPPPTEELWKFTNWDFSWDKKHRRRAEVAPPAGEELWKFAPWNFSWDKLRRRATATTEE
ncbi:hypothetical protein B0T25DRAFT_540961 [Lasiosphaeria hispida]|uniref:Uncharacterized protein n=1 Tax=Lasiosphaeria hispida TaxID=260671 RepID=A0AAJ0HNY4_9PEZI|nr:hypothetical protein B0T25DRAFT_540961 [Lasiosphaeria hispida]